MNALKLRSIVCSIFAFVAVVCSYAYGQNSGLPSGIPNPVFHVQASEEGVIYDPLTGKVSRLLDISPSARNISSWSWLAYNYVRDKRGFPALRGNPGNSSAESSAPDNFKYQNGDVFFVVKEDTVGASGIYGAFYSYIGDDIYFHNSYHECKIYNQYSDYSIMDVGSEFSGVFNVRDVGYVAEAGGNFCNIYQNGQLKHRIYRSGIGKKISFQMNDSMYLYEFLVFENLTDTQRQQVTNYLMRKYDFQPDIPKAGMTLWARGDKGVTTDATGNVTNITDNSPANAVYWPGYSFMGGDGEKFSWDSQYVTYNCRGFTGSFVNGKSAEFFAVLSTPKWSPHYDREMLNFSGQRTLFTGATETSIKESFGRNPGDIVNMSDVNASKFTDGPQLYNVNVGGGYWEAFINETLLERENYSLSSNLSINDFYFGKISSDLSNPSKGSLYEIIVYNRKLTDAERTQVRAYLMVKYGIN